MMNNWRQVTGTILGMSIGNFAYQYFFKVTPNWGEAISQSWDQAFALLFAWLTWRCRTTPRAA
jgi:Fe2+ transport system protein B